MVSRYLKERHFFSVALICVVVLAGTLLFFRLGSAPVVNWDEGFYALMSQDVGALGVIPSIHGEPWLEKPPLGIWIMSASMKILGISAFSLRLPSALFAFASIILFFFLVRRLESTAIAFFSSALFLGSAAFLHDHMARSGDLDTMLLFTAVGALFCYVMSWKKPKWIIGAGLCVGLGLMLRGSPILLIAAVIILHAVITRPSIPIRSWVWAILATGVIALPWHVFAWMQYGEEFVTSYIGRGLTDRIVGAIDAHAEPWYFYFIFLWSRLGLLLPISLFGTAWALIKGIKDRRMLLVGLWVAIPLFAISIMQTKVNWYVMPILPAMLLAAILLVRDVIKLRQRWILIAFVATLSILWLVDPFFHVMAWDLHLRIITWLCAIVSSVAATLIVYRGQNEYFWKNIFSGAVVSLVTLIVIKGVFGAMNTPWSEFSSPPVSIFAEVLDEKNPSDQVWVFTKKLGWIHGWLLPQAEWYLNTIHEHDAVQVSKSRAQVIIVEKNNQWFITDQYGISFFESIPQADRFVIEEQVDQLFLVHYK